MEQPAWVKKGMSFNEYVSYLPVPHKRTERVAYMTALRDTRDTWNKHLLELQRAMQMEELQRLLNVHSFEAPEDVELEDADGVQVN